jgi:hypothetical protein
MTGVWGTANDPRLKNTQQTSAQTGGVWGTANDPRLALAGNSGLTNQNSTASPYGYGNTGNVWGTANDPRLQQNPQTNNPNSTASPYGYGYTGNDQYPPMEYGDNLIGEETFAELPHTYIDDPNVGTGMPPTAASPRSYSPWNYAPPPTDGSNYYGSPTHGAQATPADYAGVQQFSDAAYENARRYLDPQQAFDNRRLQQEYLNRGLDPMSAMGGEMSDQMMRQHGDQDIAAAFAAMQFGQGIQDQMFNQNFMNTKQAGDMQQAQWNNDIQRYNVEIARQIQDFAETMGYDQIDYRNAQFNEDNMRWDQQLAMLLSGIQLPDTGTLGQGGTANSTKPSISPWGDTYDKLRGKIGY